MNAQRINGQVKACSPEMAGVMISLLFLGGCSYHAPYLDCRPSMNSSISSEKPISAIPRHITCVSDVASRTASSIPVVARKISENVSEEDSIDSTRDVEEGGVTDQMLRGTTTPNGLSCSKSTEFSDNLFPEVEGAEPLVDVPPHRSRCASLIADIADDHRNFYSADVLVPLAFIYAGSAVLANTQGDREFAEKYHSGFHHRDELSRLSNIFQNGGDGYLIVPALLAAAVAGNVFPDSETAGVVDVWGTRSLRAILVGAPAVVAFQYLTGGSRPMDIGQDSRWKPLRDKNGVSGHAFMGAVPFLTAARMTEDPYWKTGLYLGSTLTAWSRVHDEKHYLSQVILGWSMAWFSTQAVWRTDSKRYDVTISPTVFNEGAGFMMDWRY